MGFYVATLPFENADIGHELTLFNAPGRLLAVHPCRDHAMAAFIFRRAEVQGYNHRDHEQHKRLVSEAYATDGGLVPALLEQVRAASDLYFDAVSSVRLERWSSGRVVLVGDAASCISLFGNGSSLALTGGYTLAKELNATSDCRAAFDRYEARHRLLTEPQHRALSRGTSVLIPNTQLGIAARNCALRLWPLVVGAARLFSGVTAIGTRLLGSGSQ